MAEPAISWPAEAQVIIPQAKEMASLRLDPDVLEFFRKQGPGFHTRMNAVLRAYMLHAQGRDGN